MGSILHQLRAHRGRRVTAIVLLLCIALAAGAVVLLPVDESSSVNVLELQGVSAVDLKLEGITLYQPLDGEVTESSPDSAVVAVLASQPEAKIREVVLANVSDEQRSPGADRLLWVVSLNVDGVQMPVHGGPGCVPFTTFVYSIVFVDPATASPQYSVSLGSEIPPCSSPPGAP